MSRLEEVGEADGWRCWLCDEPVDPERSVNDDRGPSIDSRTTARKAKAKSKDSKGGRGATAQSSGERIAHRACNTGKGNMAPVVEWHDDLFVVEPAPIISTVERLRAKGGRELLARCPTQADADRAADWIVDRISRLDPELAVEARVESGGGQYLLVLHAV